MYGLLARSVKISADKLTYRFTLRPEARFHDGSKITAQDVAFSIGTLKAKGHPVIQQQLRDMTGVSAPDDRDRDVCSEARARCTSVCRVAAGILKSLLRQTSVRGIDA